jgi:hypothetical protein
MCRHLIELDNYIKRKGIKELFRGKAWSENCNEWVFYDRIIDIDKIKEKIKPDKCVTVHKYYDIKIANELGFFCSNCNDAIIGFLSINEHSKTVIKLE